MRACGRTADVTIEHSGISDVIERGAFRLPKGFIRRQVVLAGLAPLIDFQAARGHRNRMGVNGYPERVFRR